MNPDFQQAIEMSRSGDKVGAQKKVTAILKDDPNNAQAWYLLSLLVDSDQKRAVYLSKVVSLDPNHEKAMEQLELLEATSTPPPHIPEVTKIGFLEQAEANSVPDWMGNGFDTDMMETAVLEEPDPEVEDVPEWVQEDISDSWVAEENSIIAPIKPTAKQLTPPPSKTAQKPSAAAKKKARKKKKEAQNLNILLVGLIIFAAIVALILVSMLF